MSRRFGGLVACWALCLSAAFAPPAPAQGGAAVPGFDEEPVPLREEVRLVSHAFSVVSGQAPRILFRGRSNEFPLVLRNDGRVPWSEETGFALSYHVLSLGGEILQKGGSRTRIPRATKTGETVSVVASISDLKSAGLFRLRLDVVQERVLWASDVDDSPEPARLALVLPSPPILAGCLVPLGAALFGLFLVSRRSERGFLSRLAPWADLLWCGAALAWKPSLLYGELQIEPSAWVPWTTLSTVALALLLLVWLPRRIRGLAAWGMAAFASLYLWGDLIHYRFFGDLATTSTLLGVHQTGELGESIGYLAQRGDWALVPDLVLALPLALGPWRRRRRSPSEGNRPEDRPSSRGVVAALLVLALVPGIVRIWRETVVDTGRLRKTRPPIAETEENGIWAFQLQDFAAQARRRWIRRPLGDDELVAAFEWFAGRAGERRSVGPWAGVARGRNLLLIQVESLQSFVPGFTWQGQAVTPHLDRLSRSALVFTEFQDQTSKGRSSDADFVAFTSLLPVADSVAYEYAGNDFTTLVDELREMGYDTLSAVPFRPSFWNRQVTHPAYGFEKSLFADDFQAGEEIGWGLSDRDLFRQMLPRLEALPRPFCAWLTTLSVHYPYRTFPEPHKVLDLGPWEGTPLGNYLHGMSYFDRALGELWQGLEASGLLESTVVALWGDHDSTLHLRKEFAEPLGIRSPVPGRLLADQVPFMIWLPGEGAPVGEVEFRAGHLDIAPTLLALLGGEPAKLAWAGRNLLGAPEAGPVAHPRGSWVDADHAFVGGRGELERGECWNHRDWRRVPAAECAAGHEVASRQLEISELVLRYDLQARIGEALGEEGAAVGILPPAQEEPVP